MTRQGTRFFRVIDYKTGSAEFSYTDLYYGLKLQLPLYLAAVAAADDAAHRALPAGFYYLPVKTPVLEEGLSGEALLKEVQKAFRLRGVSLKNAELLEAGGGRPWRRKRERVCSARRTFPPWRNSRGARRRKRPKPCARGARKRRLTAKANGIRRAPGAIMQACAGLIPRLAAARTAVCAP